MGGFSSVTGDETIMFSDNASFDGTQRDGKMTANGQLWIGSSTAPHVRVGTLTAGSNITIANSASGITISSTGGSSLTSYSAWLFNTILNATGDSTNAPIVWDQESYNNGGFILAGSGITIPSTGSYLITYNVVLYGAVAGTNTVGAGNLQSSISGGVHSITFNPGAIVNTVYTQSALSGQIGVQLSAGEVLTLYGQAYGGAKIVGIQGAFGGFRTTSITIVKLY